MAERANDVLMVDDNPGDRRFIKESLHNSQMDITAHTVKTKDEALDWIAPQREYKEAPKPDVILLDWSLSQDTSEEVVNVAKSGDSPIPVVVMTDSNPERSDLESAVSQADMYIQKPTEPEGYIEPLQSLLSDE